MYQSEARHMVKGAGVRVVVEKRELRGFRFFCVWGAAMGCGLFLLRQGFGGLTGHK